MTEIVSCPRCQRKLQVPEDFIGRQVQCPECQSTFVASTTAVSAQPTSKAPAPTPDSYEQRRRRDDYDEDERRRRRDDDYDDDDDLDDMRRRRIRRDYLAPHRGTLLLVLGLVGIVGGFSFCLPVVVGPFCWFMAQRDLIEMREGRMDPTGEGTTRTGLVLGIANTIFLVLGIGLIIFAIVAGF